MTSCPDTGSLRASLDGEAPDAVGAHVRVCSDCAEEREALRTTAAAVGTALALLDPSSDTATAPLRAEDDGWAGLRPVDARPVDIAEPAPDGAGPLPAPIALPRRRRSDDSWQRRAAAVAVVVALAAGVVGTPVGRQAAASFLSAFRGEQLTVVTMDPRSVGDALTAMERLGEVEGLEDGSVAEPVPSVAEAERRVGFPVTLPEPSLLPDRFTAQPPEIAAMEARQVTIAFDEVRVAQYLAEHDADPAIPEGLGETTLVIAVPSAVVALYRGPDEEPLAVAESGLVTADVRGPLDLEAVRAFLLDLPALPPEAVQQLRAIDDWRTTLPLPVPVDGPSWRDTTVGGGDAVLFSDTIASALLWQSDGRVRGVGGVVDEATVRAIADGLDR